MKKEVWVAVSGGFDPIHMGHVRMMQKARTLGDRLVVIVNNDNWLRKKKKFVFMPQQERVELIRSFSFVDKVVLTDHAPDAPDMSVARTLRKLKPAIFANGGDRVKTNTPEDAVCRELNIKRAYRIGGGKIQSSSWMIHNAAREKITSRRPWGEFQDVAEGHSWHLKTITVHPQCRLSLQKHAHRSELWVLVEGDATAEIEVKGKMRKTRLKKFGSFEVPLGVKHRLSSQKGGVLVEIARGDFDENDIERFQDDFGRPIMKKSLQ
ncbi:MAG TPA: adenylyltransferase/cytidyltransferase family protein [Candidatus Paceibacterota bacterium]|nr:adenylyltransferase/cytidyltransferase family protein [Candidatus Paceibacterota bacterium]